MDRNRKLIVEEIDFVRVVEMTINSVYMLKLKQYIQTTCSS